MGDTNNITKTLEKHYKISVKIKYLVFTLFILMILLFFVLDFLNSDFFNKEKDGSICGDETLINNCSSVKPYFCLNGELIDLASVCGCPDNFIKRNDSCISIYQTNPKEITLNYVLRGENYSINFTAYEGFVNYLSQLSRSIRYSNGDESSRADFKLKAINEEEQKKLLLPLVVQIQNITSNKEDQARIAISIVQNIPFGASNKTSTFGSYQVNYSRYPYEVLYDMQGICGEKTDLLAFLLREIGYGTSFFYYPLYNHEALGIKCSVKESIMGTSYCFIETTAPAIITDNKISYVGVGKIYESPQIYFVSEGISLGDNIYEYSDAEQLIRIRDAIAKDGMLNPLRKIIFENLKEKYGLAEYYYG